MFMSLIYSWDVRSSSVGTIPILTSDCGRLSYVAWDPKRDTVIFKF